MFRIYGIKQNKLRKMIKRAFKKQFKKNKQLFKQLSKLKKLGYVLAILSDQVPMSHEVFEKYYKLSKKVDVPIWSYKEKLRKPNPKIYRLCIKKMKIDPDEAVFIDNRKWNLVPAKKIGIKTILFENNKQLFNNKIWKRLFL